MSRVRDWWHLQVLNHTINETHVEVVDLDKHVITHHAHNHCSCGAHWMSR